MKQFAVIGNPVAHSLSPIMHNWVFKQLDIDANYRRIQIEKSSLSQIMTELRNGTLQGVNVTLPFKQEIISLLDDIHIIAQYIQAVNCVIKKKNRLLGCNTDWYGFFMLLKQNNITTEGKSFILLGAGGAAKSVLYALIRKEVETVFIINRTPERSQSLVDSMGVLEHNTSLMTGTYDKLEEILPSNAVIVNCTPLGMTPNTNISPFPSHLMREDLILIDTIYTPLETLFLRDGKAAGAQVAGGLEMFLYQGLASLDLWFKEKISQQVILKNLRNYLTIQLS